MAGSDFLEKFSTCVARRDYDEALALCDRRLKEAPGDRFALELRQSIKEFNTAVLASEAATPDASSALAKAAPPSLESMREQAREACSKGAEAAFAYLQDEDRVCSMGEQAVGIFFDTAVTSPPGAFRERLLEMSRVVLSVLERRLRTAIQGKEVEAAEQVTSTAAVGQVEDATGQQAATEAETDWLFEALGILWFQAELGMDLDDEFVKFAWQDWTKQATMQALVGYSQEGLASVPDGEFCDVLVSVWTLERSVICGLFDSMNTPPPLEYGVEQVFAEIRRRPLAEPPLHRFYDQFYLMTHVIYCLNSWNGCLPNCYDTCPWLYNFVERGLRFWLHEARADLSTDSELSLQRYRYHAESVDGVAEAIDNLRGLGVDRDTEVVREAVAWLLSRQEEDGFFYSPGEERPAPNEYEHLHPTWVAIAALQLEREHWADQAEPSKRAAAWSRHAREAARKAGFHVPPEMFQSSLAGITEEASTAEGHPAGPLPPEAANASSGGSWRH